MAWADLIFAMESEHCQRLVEEHREILGDTPVHVLDIPDEYGFLDPELIEVLSATVTPIIDAYRQNQ